MPEDLSGVTPLCQSNSPLCQGLDAVVLVYDVMNGLPWRWVPMCQECAEHWFDDTDFKHGDRIAPEAPCYYALVRLEHDPSLGV